jgi:hypothetical protein
MDFQPNKLRNKLSSQHTLASFGLPLEAYHCPFPNGLFHLLTFQAVIDHLIMLFQLFEVLIAKLGLN